jgi:3-methyladenine DNA glycosylase Tag
MWRFATEDDCRGWRRYKGRPPALDAVVTSPITPRTRFVWHHLGVTSASPMHTDAEYLDNLTRKIFISGFSGDPVATRCPRFRAVFYAFDPGTVAEMPDLLIDHLQQDPGIIRNKRKLRATVANASEFVQISEEFGSFYDYLRSLDDLSYERRAREIGKRFASVGPNTVYYFLEDAGEPVPPVKPEGVKSRKKRLAKRSLERAR